MQIQQHSCILLAIVSAWSIDDRVLAQVIPDSTLPSQVTNNGNSTIIDGGTTKGSNLFHSFKQFSVPTGGTVHFNNALQIQNIFSRVTGNNISSIDGILKNNGTANLFLINPRGIVFGRNARLNLGGSFLATTADRVDFADGKVFSAIEDRPILTVSVPITLNFSQHSGPIQVIGNGGKLSLPNKYTSPAIRNPESIGLSVRPNRTLALVGQNINFDGGILTAPGGRIELGSVDIGKVWIEPSVSGWILNYQNVPRFQDIKLSQEALVDVSGTGSGSAQLRGRQLSLLNGSVVLLQNQGDRLFGNLDVGASESLLLVGTNSDGKIVSAFVSETLGFGNAGDINIRAPKILFQNGGGIVDRTFTSAKGGNIRINAPDFVRVTGFNPIEPTAFSVIGTSTVGSGDAGDLRILTRKLDVSNLGAITSSTFKNGSGGNILIEATESVEISGSTPFKTYSSISSNTLNSGNAGSLTINTTRLLLKDGGTLDSSTFSTGNAGNVTINASESIEMTNLALATSGAIKTSEYNRQLFQIPPILSGDSGNIRINTGFLKIDNSLVTVKNEGTGNAGTLTINASKISLTSGGSITAATASGNGGEITINSSDLRLDAASITATAGNMGNGGNIDINTDALVLDNSAIAANAFQGDGGNIDLNTSILLQRNSDITASSELGLDGNVEIDQLISPNSVFGVTPPIEIADRNIVTTSCSLSSPKFYIRGSDRVPALPDLLEFTPNPNGTVALIYVSPKAFGHPDSCSN